LKQVVVDEARVLLALRASDTVIGGMTVVAAVDRGGHR